MNNERSAALGIPGLRVPERAPAPPRRRTAGTKEPAVGSRRSSRLADLPAPQLSLDLEETEEWSDRAKKSRKEQAVHPDASDGEPLFGSAGQQQLASVASGAAKAGSTRALLAAVPQLRSRLGELLVPTDGTGAYKNAATECLHGARRSISFNKYSGVQEWKNAVALFVNVRGKTGSAYPNLFLDSPDGRQMTWFAQPSHAEDTPVIQRILASRGQTEANGRSDVVLFAREEGCPYVYCGLLAAICHYPTAKPALKILFRLVDSKELDGSAEFQRLLGA